MLADAATWIAMTLVRRAVTRMLSGITEASIAGMRTHTIKE
jgi:hypothetical protein